MITNLKILPDNVSWNFDGKNVIVNADHVFWASENRELDLVKIDTGRNYIEKKVLFYNFDGSLELSYDLEIGIIEWIFGGIKRHLHVMNMKQVGFFPQKGRIFVIVAHNEQELQGYTLEGKQIFAESSPLGFEMQYFITANDKVMVVCDGNGENADKYGRFRYNFYLDTDTGELTKESIAY